MSSYKLIDDN